MRLQDKLLISSFLGFFRDFRFLQIHALSESLYLVLSLLGDNFYLSDPCTLGHLGVTTPVHLGATTPVHLGVTIPG